jgi:glycosyltransferase involved in cell wall biosynthesis
MRLLVYIDYVFRREGEVVYAPRAFATFAAALRGHVERLVLVGRLDPSPGRSHYRLPDDVEFLPLPHYESAAGASGLAAALAGSLRTFARALRSVDAVWVLGPQGLAVPFALLTLAGRRHLVLGVRQDLPRYARSRHPGRRLVHLAADLLDGAFRTLARRAPTAAVGPELAERYGGGRAVLPVAVSLVRHRALEGDGPVRDWDGSELRLLSVGRLEEEKNPLLLADVLAHLRATDPRWKLVVCGEGPLEGALRGRLAHLGADNHAELRGYVPLHDGLEQLYREAHAFLHVSWTEGLPQVLYEACAARLPIVATAVGGVPRAVDGAALLVPPGDAGAAARQLERLAGDEDLRAGLVERGLALAREHTLEAETARLFRFMEGTAGG